MFENFYYNVVNDMDYFLNHSFREVFLFSFYIVGILFLLLVIIGGILCFIDYIKEKINKKQNNNIDNNEKQIYN